MKASSLICSYLMNAKVGIGVKVVIPGGHLIRGEELGHLSSAGETRKAGRVRRVGWVCGPLGVMDRWHRFGERGWLDWLWWGGTQGLLLIFENETWREAKHTKVKFYHKTKRANRCCPPETFFGHKLLLLVTLYVRHIASTMFFAFPEKQQIWTSEVSEEQRRNKLCKKIMAIIEPIKFGNIIVMTLMETNCIIGNIIIYSGTINYFFNLSHALCLKYQLTNKGLLL